MRGINFREADKMDAEAIARLHARSWQLHYRGSFSDSYLDGPVEQERLQVWTRRMTHPAPEQYVIVAENQGQIIGFLCLYALQDPKYGSLIDNLHVSPEYRGSGVGRRLMELAKERLVRQVPGSPYFLWVLGVNEQAIGFYEMIGGRRAEEAELPNPDGGRSMCYRYVWDAFRSGT